MKELKIAIILPPDKRDGLAETIINGMSSLAAGPDYKLHLRVHKDSDILPESFFIKFAQKADFVLLVWGKEGTNIKLGEKIGAWEKTFFIDGSELGKNRRLDKNIIQEVLSGVYQKSGAINFELLKKCSGYFRRESPYIEGIIPLPFGIERKYVQYNKNIKKDIDFVCIFGQEDYPPLRREVRLTLEKFCTENNFSNRTLQTKVPFFGIYNPFAQYRFRSLLARAKVGVSVSGGGFDTFRFWEILGNNCILLTEKIDIYPRGSKALDYKRIWEFSNLDEFKEKLNQLGKFLREGYTIETMMDEYKEILKNHSSEARALSIIEEAEKKGLLQ